MSKTILLVSAINDILETIYNKYFTHMGFELIRYNHDIDSDPVDFVVEINFQRVDEYCGLKNQDNIFRINNTSCGMYRGYEQTKTDYTLEEDDDWTIYEPIFSTIYNRLWLDDF